MDWLVLIVKETAFFFNEVAIYLILGFAIAAVLHVLFPESIIRRHFGQSSFSSVFKSTLFGIPLPICSCGVVPVDIRHISHYCSNDYCIASRYFSQSIWQ